MPAAPEPAGGPAAVPVCPRHPGVESYVRCQRCERPVCPQCQRPAAVGVQCVDCVREQRGGVRGARTVFGGRAGDGRPVVTRSLIGVCVLVFALQFARPGLTEDLAFAPPFALAEPYTFLTAAFLHSPTFLLHIAFNMYALWMVGPELEHLFGRLRFTALYLLAAVGGSVGYFVLADPDDGSWSGATVGASGAVFGLFGALLVVNRRLGRDTGGIVALIAINGALGFIISGIAWQAHLGGLLTGAAAAAVLAHAPRRRRHLVQGLGLALVLLLIVVLAAVKVVTAPAQSFV